MLREAGDFQAIRNHGQSVAGRLIRVSILRKDGDSLSQVAVVTSKRVGQAVERVKVRRRIREILRVLRADLPRGLQIVVTAKASAAVADFATLRSECHYLLRKLLLLPKI